LRLKTTVESAKKNLL